ncbi:MAG: hypothetical protein WCJ30_28095, partial [Deltaproteobacteria bacterium]
MFIVSLDGHPVPKLGHERDRRNQDSFLVTVSLDDLDADPEEIDGRVVVVRNSDARRADHVSVAEASAFGERVVLRVVFFAR